MLGSADSVLSFPEFYITGKDRTLENDWVKAYLFIFGNLYELQTSKESATQIANQVVFTQLFFFSSDFI